VRAGGFDEEYRVPGRSVGPLGNGELFFLVAISAGISIAFTSFLGSWRAMVMGAFGDNAAYSGVASTTGTSPTCASSISWVTAVFLVARLFPNLDRSVFRAYELCLVKLSFLEVLNRWLWPSPWALFGCSAAAGFLLPSGWDR
jgi:hypothetical protein